MPRSGGGQSGALVDEAVGVGAAVGGQVSTSYGSKKPNDDLLLSYGFVADRQRRRRVRVPDLLAWMLPHRPDVINKDRTETLFSKGLQDVGK